MLSNRRVLFAKGLALMTFWVVSAQVHAFVFFSNSLCGTDPAHDIANSINKTYTSVGRATKTALVAPRGGREVVYLINKPRNDQLLEVAQAVQVAPANPKTDKASYYGYNLSLESPVKFTVLKQYQGNNLGQVFALKSVSISTNAAVDTGLNFYFGKVSITAQSPEGAIVPVLGVGGGAEFLTATNFSNSQAGVECHVVVGILGAQLQGQVFHSFAGINYAGVGVSTSFGPENGSKVFGTFKTTSWWGGALDILEGAWSKAQ
jgi:hypothetical protein